MQDERPLAYVPDLPDDVFDAFESMKLAAMRHNLAGWTEISLEDFLSMLETLKRIAEQKQER